MSLDVLQQVLLDNINAKRDVNQLPAALLFQGGSVFVKYYSVNRAYSSTAVAFGDVNAILDPESPVRYDEYKNFPLLSFQEFGSPELAYDEQKGFNLPRESRAIVAPDLLAPMEGDLFILNHETETNIFIVKSVSPTNVQNRPFHRIVFEPLEIDILVGLEYLANQIIKKYTCSSLGVTDNKISVVSDDLYQSINYLESLLSQLMDIYLEIFYDSRYQTLLYYDNVNLYVAYNIHLIYFQKETLAIKWGKNDLLIRIENLKGMDFIRSWYKSIFAHVLRQEAITEESRTFVINDYVKYFNYNLLSRISKCKIFEHKLTVNATDDTYILPWDIDNNKIDKMINSFTTNSETVIEDFIDGLKFLLQNSNITTMEYYIKIPIVFYIVRKIVEQFTSNNSIRMNDYNSNL